MRKTILYLVILAILGFGVYYFLFSNRQAFATNEAGFSIPDTASVGKIYLADKSGQTVLLERKDSGWLLNKKYPAIQQHVTTLLTTLARQAPMHPVTESQHDNVIKGLATEGIKVEVYNNGGKKLRVFYVGGQVLSNSGTYMLMQGAERPYVVQIPGMEGYLTPRYSTDQRTWRDRNIVNITAENLKSVSVNYISEPLNSFTLTQNNGKIAVAADTGLTRGKEVNATRATGYTHFFTNVNSEVILNGNTGLDTLFRTLTKRCVIDITSAQGQKQHIDVYWMPINRRSKNQLSPDPAIPEGYDADRFFATTNNFQDTVIIQRVTFDKIFRKAYEFYQADEAPGTKVDTIFNTVKMGAAKQ